MKLHYIHISKGFRTRLESGCNWGHHNNQEYGHELSPRKFHDRRYNRAIMSNDELIELAAKAINPRITEHGRIHGDVGAALVSENGSVYLGTCVDTPSWGLCAERSAIAAMITAGEYKIAKIVAVWRDQKSNTL